MTVLLDAGPIVAAFDRREPNHDACAAALLTAPGPLVTCDAVIAEACHLLRSIGTAPRDLLLDVEDARYLVDYRLSERAGVIARLMSKYSNVPMDLADACLVDLAAIHGTGQILTLDADFRVYRWGRNRPFELLLDV